MSQRNQEKIIKEVTNEGKVKFSHFSVDSITDEMLMEYVTDYYDIFNRILIHHYTNTSDIAKTITEIAASKIRPIYLSGYYTKKCCNNKIDTTPMQRSILNKKLLPIVKKYQLTALLTNRK